MKLPLAGRPLRVMSAVEVLASVGTVLVGVWWVGPNIGALWAKLVYLGMLVVGVAYVGWISPSWLHSDSRASRGFVGGARFRADVRSYGTLILLGAVALFTMALWRDPTILHRIVWRSVGLKLVLYLPFSFLQDLFVFGFLMNRIRDAMAPLRASSDVPTERVQRVRVVLATALAFTVLHLPNRPLMGFVFVGATLAGWLFYGRPNITLLAVGHALLGTILHRFVELPMRIGPFYQHPHVHFTRALVPGLRSLIGNLY